MRRQRWWLPLVALLFVTNWKSTLSLPVPDEELDTSTKLLGSSVVTSVSVVTGSSDNVAVENSMKTISTADRMRVIPSKDLPGSPADLLRPDRFQFYTLNKEGNVVTKQMTEQEIHSLIAAGGGQLPMEIHEPQKPGDVPSGGMKVSDVVQNVQNVLKGELNKPTTVMTSVPTIPGHPNTEWSSILPAILGGESETASVSEPITTVPIENSEAPITIDKAPVVSHKPAEIPTIPIKLPAKETAMTDESSKKPAGILETETHDEIPMIQVPVITVDQKLPYHQAEEDSLPVFQMLNTISVDKTNAINKTHVDEKPKPVADLGQAHTAKPNFVKEPIMEDSVVPVDKIPTKPNFVKEPIVEDSAVSLDTVPAKPDFVKEPIVDHSTVPAEKLPEIVEISLDSGNVESLDPAGVKKPLVKPESEIITAETIAKLPESEQPATMTVVSETHSTSMKVSGHEEIPLRDPPKPLIEVADPPAVPSEIKKPEKETEKTPIVSSTNVKLDATTLKAEAPATTEKPSESTNEPGLFAQGVSFFGNLPQTVSSIVSDFIANNKPVSTPVVEEADAKIPLKNSQTVNESVATINSAKIHEPTKSPAPETTASIHEDITSTKPIVDQEPVFQMMPEIIPDKKIPAHGTLPSEVSSIEHIIETLNDPTGSLSGTVAADHFTVHKIPENKLNMSKIDVMQTETPKTSLVPEIQTSTKPTPISVETPDEPSPAKPMEPLPTDLADSLSSMISQISDPMPSVLPIGDNVGLDATEKKTSANVNADEHTTESAKTPDAQVVSETSEVLANRVQFPAQAPSRKPEAVPTEVPAREDVTISSTSAVKETTEKLKNSPSMEGSTSASVTTEASKLDTPTTVKINVPLVEKESPEVTPSSNPDTPTDPITVKIDVPLVKKESTEVPVDGVEKPVAEKLEAPGPESEKSKLELDKVGAPSDITTDKLVAQAIAQESVKMETLTELPVTDVTIQQTSTGKPATESTSSASSTLLIVTADQTEIPLKTQTERPMIVLEPLKSENQKTEVPIKTETNENNTELPIVRIDITEAKPTQFTHVDKSQVSANADNGGESPFVRIKLTDPLTMIHNMIASANVDVSPPPVAPLSLPESGSIPPNTIASGLIAGYPSSTTQSTNSANLTEENPMSTIGPATSPEVEIRNDGSAINVTGNVEPSVVEVENTAKTETPGTPELNKGSNLTEKLESPETFTSKNDSIAVTDIPADRIDLLKVPDISKSPEKGPTVQASSKTQTSTEKSKVEEPISEITPNKSVEIESPTTLATTQKTPEDHNTSTLLIQNVTAVPEETPTKISDVPIGEVPANRIEISAPSIVQEPESVDKLNEASKIIEMTVNISNPEIDTEQPALMEVKSENPEVSPVSTNSTKPEVPDMRIDLTPEKLAEMPSKIQLTDLPIVETTVAPIKPVKNELVQTFLTTEKPQSVATVQGPVDTSKDNVEASSKDSLPATTMSIVEKATADPIKETPVVEVTSENPVKTSEESREPERNAENPIPAAQQTEEIRIQVNNTAVLVTKRPISEPSSQKPEKVEKISESQAIDEPTTPKTPLITEDPYAKLGEKIELPVPVKVSELSSSHDGVAVDTIKEDAVPPSGTETRIRLGEEQQSDKNKGDKLSTKVDDTRKPIKKNSDSDSSPIEDKDTPSSTTNASIIIDDKPSANREDSNPQSSIKVEITKPVSSNVPSAVSKIVESVKVEATPTKSSSKDKPVKVIAERPISKPVKSAHKPTMNIKKDDALPRPGEDQWTLIPQQVYPALTKTGGSNSKRPTTTEEPTTNLSPIEQKISSSERPSVSLDNPQSASGLDSTVRNLETDISYFANLCNELAFSFWTATNKGLSTARSLAVSPFGMTSMLAMVFLGARGPTSDQMNDILKLDDVASFNPHLVFQNVTDAVGLARNQGIANAAFVRELFADRSKVRKLMPFYKDQAQQFYDGIVAEVNFATISDLVRRRTNLMIRKQTGGRIKDFVRTNTVPLRSPLAALSANVFQTDCNSSAASSEGRDGELYFAVSPAVRQRKLVPVPATVWRAGVLAGYEPGLDATAVALGGVDKLVSTIFVIPGQQGHTAPGDTLDRLEQRVIRGATHDGSWNKLLKVLIPRPGLELQVPKFSHRSVINATAALKRMGLEELFSKHADLKGINGVAADLHLADVLQMNLFSTCGDENIISGRHHVEVYPGSPLRNARKFNDFEEQTDNGFTDYPNDEENHGFEGSAVPYVSHREARSARQNDGTEKQRLKLDRPFLYFVRHNPTGLILHMGRFNPRLLP